LGSQHITRDNHASTHGMGTNMTEHKPPVKIEDQAPALEHKQDASVAKANASDKCYIKLLEKTLLLDAEDEKLYAQLHDAILDDVKPQSFLEKIAAKDLVDKIFGELRGRARRQR
jgi:hypothetical protein